MPDTLRNTPDPAGPSGALPPARILVVDDDVFNVDLLLFELQDAGFEGIGAGSAREALRIIEQEPGLDLILLDVMMPGMDGLELTQLLKTRPETREIPVILLTARGELGDKAEGFSAGAEDYVVKPFDSDELRARIEVQLRIRRLRLEEERLGSARARLAMIGTAAHQLSQPLSGATGFLQLLQVMIGRGSQHEQERERLLQVDGCLERTMNLAAQLATLHRFRTEDYACGTEIVDLDASSGPADPGDRVDEEGPLILVADPISEQLPAWFMTLRQDGWRILRVSGTEELEPGLRPWVLVLNQVLPTEIPHWLSTFASAEGITPFSLLISRAQSGDFRGRALRAGVDDILTHPPNPEELLMRVRARVTLFGLQRGHLRLTALEQARAVGERAFMSFQPTLDTCRLLVAELISEASVERRKALLADLAGSLERLTGTIRLLQSRRVPELPGRPSTTTGEPG